MNIHPIPKRILATLALIVLVLAAYLLWARPYQLHWGATSEEISRPMPGDELIDLRQRIVRLEGQVEYLYKRLGINIDVEPASADESEVIDALQKGNLIEAIKVYRQLYNVGLAEAKTAVENLKYRLNI